MTTPDSTNPKHAIGMTKVPLGLWPISATIAGCMALFLGKTKYGRSNWRATPVVASTYYDALLRHAAKWWEGEELDADDGTPHLGNCLACIAILIDAKICGTLIDDRQYNGLQVVATFNQYNHLIPTLTAKYADKAPQHYTLQSLDGAKVITVTIQAGNVQAQTLERRVEATRPFKQEVGHFELHMTPEQAREQYTFGGLAFSGGRL